MTSPLEPATKKHRPDASAQRKTVEELQAEFAATKAQHTKEIAELIAQITAMDAQHATKEAEITT